MDYHLQRDLASVKPTTCVYSTLVLAPTQYGKKYKLCRFLRALGFFHSSTHRRFFMYSLLDTCAYSRHCPACHIQINDVLTHALTRCCRSRQLRLILRLKLLLYNADNIDTKKLDCKTNVFSMAMESHLIRRALCEFLISLGYYTQFKPQ